jgi:hypothetical protein
MELSKYKKLQDEVVYYYGFRLPPDDETRVVISQRTNSGFQPLPEYREHVSHSHGFEWGYEGSGPAQLAFALLYNVTDDKEVSLKYYQRFKVAYVSRQPMDGGWKTTDTEIADWLEKEIKETAPLRK